MARRIFTARIPRRIAGSSAKGKNAQTQAVAQPKKPGKPKRNLLRIIGIMQKRNMSVTIGRIQAEMKTLGYMPLSDAAILNALDYLGIAAPHAAAGKPRPAGAVGRNAKPAGRRGPAELRKVRARAGNASALGKMLDSLFPNESVHRKRSIVGATCAELGFSPRDTGYIKLALDGNIFVSTEIITARLKISEDAARKIRDEKIPVLIEALEKKYNK